jgi:hypothetical protein
MGEGKPRKIQAMDHRAGDGKTAGSQELFWDSREFIVHQASCGRNDHYFVQMVESAKSEEKLQLGIL